MSDNDKFKIVVADDEESIRSIVGEVLSDEGYTVELAANGKEALDIVHAGGVHVVITDIRMPEMTGIELLENVKEHDKNVEVVIMTSYASIETAIKAIRLGAYDYLTKPFEDLNIIPTVIDRTIGKLRLELEVQRLLKALKKRNQEINNLYESTSELMNVIKPKEVLQQAVTKLCELSGATGAIFYKWDADHHQFIPDVSHPPIEETTIESVTVPQEILDTDQFIWFNDGSKLLNLILAGKSKDNVTVAPLFESKTLSGAFCIISEEEIIVDDTRALINQFIGNISMQYEKAKLHSAIETMAIVDELTGIHNRRHFQTMITNEIARAKRFKQTMSIILFDIDNFKNYNDTNGHLAGDKLLRELGALLRETSRNIDILARYGGEEFVIILLETDKEGAACRAEKLRKQIEDCVFDHQEKQPNGNLTISGGFAEYPRDGEDGESLVKAADDALYKAKEQGRNRILPA